TGVTPENLAAVNAQVLAQPTGGADTAPEVQTLVNTLNVAINAIVQAAENNTATSTALTAGTFTDAGVTGVTSADLPLIREMLDTASITGTSVGSTAQIQALVDAVKQVAVLADGTNNSTVDLSPASITALGLGSVIDSAAERSLFTDMLDNSTSGEANQAAEILNLAGIADRIAQTAAGQTPATPVSAAELTAIGLVDVDPALMTAVLAAIAATANDGSAVDTLAKLQGVIDNVNLANSEANPVIAEAVNGLSATELADGIQISVALPDKVIAGASLRLEVTLQPSGTPQTIIHTVTAQELASGTVALTMPAGTVGVDGGYTVTSTVTNPNGVATTPSVINITLDTTAPAVAITSIAGNPVTATAGEGELNAAERGTNLTSLTTPVVVAGTTSAEAGTTVQVSLNSKTYNASVQAGASGQPNTWSLTVPDADAVALVHGTAYSVSVQATDTAGNVTSDNSHYSLRINTALPDVPTIHALKTNDTTPVLTGQALKVIDPNGDLSDLANYIPLSAGDTVEISLNGAPVVTASVGVPTPGFSYNAATRTWTLDTGAVSGFSTLANGTHEVTVRVTAGGVTKSDVSAGELQVNTTPPTLTLAPVAVDNTVNGAEDAQALVLTGTTNAAVGSTVSLTFDGQPYTAQVQATAQGNTFSITIPANVVDALSEGDKTLALTVTNEFGASAQVNRTVTVDTVATTAPTLAVAELAQGVSFAEAADGLQVSMTLAAGTAEGDVIVFTVTQPDNTVLSYEYTVTATDITNAAANTPTLVTVPNSLLGTNGSYSLNALVRDEAGNVGTPGTAVPFTLDTQAPGTNPNGTPAATPAPVLAIAEAAGGLTATELSDGIQIQVTLPSGSVVGDILSITFTDPSGDVRTFTHTVSSSDLSAASTTIVVPASFVSEDGNYSVSATTTDTSGNSSAPGTTSFDLAGALSTLIDAAQGNTATSSNLAPSVYEQAGVTGVTTDNVGAINSALDSAPVNGAAVDSVAKVQAVVNAYTAILAEANDSANTPGDGTADATPLADPTAAQYAAIGATLGAAATDAENLALLNDIVGAKQTGDVDTIAEINELARIANAIQTVAAGGTPTPALTIADLSLAGLDTSTLTPDNLAAVLVAIAAQNNDGSATDSLSELQILLNNAVTHYNTAVDKIADYAETGLTAPAEADYTDAGVSGVSATNLAAINDAINNQTGSDNTLGNANDREGANSAAEVQAIVDAYKAILAEANDTANSAGDGTADTTPLADPTAAQYATIGANIGAAATDADNLALLNDIVGAKQLADVDSIAEINDLARIANAIQTVAAGGTPTPALSIADLTHAGLDTTSLTPDNLAVVIAAIAAQNNDGSATDSLSELQLLLNSAVTNYTAAIDKIADYAETGVTAPSVQDYVDAGVTAVTAGNLAAINDAINNQTGSDSILGNANDREGANTAAEVQAIVDAYNVILAEANDTAATPGNGTADSTSADPTAAQYAAIGAVLGASATDTENLSLLGDIVGAQQTAGVDTVAEINNLARIVNAIQAVAAGGTPSPALTVADLIAIGIDTSNVTADTLPALMAAIVTKADGGGETDTLAKLQAIVDTAATNYATAIDKIADYAETGAIAPTIQDYLDAGVSDVTSGFAGANLAAINDAINNQAGSDSILGNANDREGANTAAEVQAIVDAYKAILAEANDTANSAGDGTADATPLVDPTAAQYATIGADIGAAATDTETLALLNDIVGAQQTAGVDTIAEINDLARIANAIQTIAAGGTASPALTPADLAKIGLSDVTDNNLAAVLAAIAAKNNDGSQTDSLAELQALVTGLNTAATDLGAFAEANTTGLATATGTVPVLTSYTAAGVTGVTADNLAAINDALA
ncbi:MAG: hypothetical protein AAB176_13145, partial [Pseudomonadota bacterium]